MIKTIHEGRNVKRLREILGIKQDALAVELDMTQQNVSQLESRETIEPDLLIQIAGVLKVPVEAIKNFSEDMAINIVSSTLHGSSFANANYNPVFNFNPIDKIIELYEALLQSEREKLEILEKLSVRNTPGV